MSETVTASDGNQLPLNDLSQAFTYSGALVQTISVQYPAPQYPFTLTTYVQTFTYSGSNLIGISNWVAT